MITDNRWNTKYHIMPPYGWLNDPNGLCYFNGKYHVFFQFRPDNCDGSGGTYWGHYTSENMMEWKFEGKAIAPDKDFDKDGAYSGSALIDEGKMYLYYTGNVKQPGNHDYTTSGREANTILVTSEDGMHFSEKQVVMDNSDYPDNLSCHIRDPKVYTTNRDSEKVYYMVQGARTKENKGEVVVFESKDKYNWKVSDVITSEDDFGYMWECPDVVKVAGRVFLSISPQGVEQKGFDFANIYQSGYYNLDRIAGKYSVKNFKEWDRGFDFYAPQTFSAPDGRTIMIGWMGIPDMPEFKNLSTRYGWQHVLTLPREIKCIFKDGNAVLTQQPVKELLNARLDSKPLVCSLKTGNASNYDVDLKNDGSDFTIIISDELYLNYESDKGTFEMKFADTDSDNAIGGGRTSRTVKCGSVTRCQVFVDVSAVEVYINSGEEVFSTRMYTEDGSSNVQINGEGCQATYYEWKS